MRKHLRALVLGILLIGVLSSVCMATETAIEVLELRGDVWQAQPTWLGNPADTFSLTVVPVDEEISPSGKAWRFEVNQPWRGMKWTARLAEYIAVPADCSLTLVYRASNVRTLSTGQAHEDFVLLIYDKYENETIPVMVHQLNTDGDWHEIVVPIPEMEMMMLVFQLQAVGNGAFIELTALQLKTDHE